MYDPMGNEICEVTMHGNSLIVSMHTKHGNVTMDFDSYDEIIKPAFEMMTAAIHQAFRVKCEAIATDMAEVPDAPPPIGPCRICDHTHPDNVQVGVSWYCPEHRPS